METNEFSCQNRECEQFNTKAGFNCNIMTMSTKCDRYFAAADIEKSLRKKLEKEHEIDALRDRFAGLAMQSIMSSDAGKEIDFQETAKWAYYAANAMINARQSQED